MTYNCFLYHGRTPFSRPPQDIPPGTGPRRLTVCQCCMNRTSVKCARYEACRCKRSGRACTGGLPSIKCCNKGPLLSPPPGGRPWAPTAPRLTTNVSEIIAEATEAAPILCQVACQVVFHPDEPEFSIPPSQLAVRDGPLYRPAPEPSPWPTRSPRPLTPTPPRQRPSVAAKTIQTAHGQRKFLPQQPDKLLTLILKSRRRPVLLRVTATQTMSSRQKPAHEIGHHAGTRGPHTRTPTDTRGFCSQDRGVYSTNVALHPDRRARPYKSCQRQYHPG